MDRSKNKKRENLTNYNSDRYVLFFFLKNVKLSI